MKAGPQFPTPGLLLPGDLDRCLQAGLRFVSPPQPETQPGAADVLGGQGLQEPALLAPCRRSREAGLCQAAALDKKLSTSLMNFEVP